MRWIYISTHLDDAIFSAGGLIYDQASTGRKVEIWTMACGFPPDEELSPFAQGLHFDWGFHSSEETIRSRRLEDQSAAAIVAARAVHFDFLDCVYRRGRDGKWMYSSNSFDPPHEDDAELCSQMTNTFTEQLEPDDNLVCPLAIGGHVDHVIVRRAVENLGRPLWYYADIPYLLNNSSALDSIGRNMQAKSERVSSEGLIAWQDAIAAYESQICMEFESPKKMRKAIASYGRRGVRLWTQV